MVSVKCCYTLRSACPPGVAQERIRSIVAAFEDAGRAFSSGRNPGQSRYFLSWRIIVSLGWFQCHVGLPLCSSSSPKGGCPESPQIPTSLGTSLYSWVPGGWGPLDCREDHFQERETALWWNCLLCRAGAFCETRWCFLLNREPSICSDQMCVPVEGSTIRSRQSQPSFCKKS